ncbi:MAG: 3-dehydroquinate synthase [Bacteroidales bacterium]|nr:3-dehydroquinate synthase [Bacteroidales bacterium]
MESLIYYQTEAQVKLNEIINKASSIVILCDANTKRHCLPHLIAMNPKLKGTYVITVPEGEKSKEWRFAMRIWEKLLKNNADRHTLLINLGGGVVCDLGAFAASVFKRGIAYVNIPTSLMAQVDAAIGGKTAININGIKNQIGTFQLPKAVCVFTEFLSTLTEQHVYAGFAEMLKHALIADKNYWDELKNLQHSGQIISASDLIKKSADIKSTIVSKDFYENNERMKLNFGHTIGHVLESMCMQHNNLILHGEAVAWGMLAEAYISREKKMLSQQALDEIETIIRFYFKPLSFIQNIDDAMRLLYADKKRVGDELHITLIRKIGTAVINQHCSEKEVKSAMQYINEC